MNLYISVDDLLEIILLIPKDSIENTLYDEELEREHNLYIRFNELVLKRSNLHLDNADKLAKRALGNTFLKYLIKKHIGSSFKLDFENYQYLDDEEYSEVCEPNIIQFKDNTKINERLGYFTCNKMNWKNEDKFPRLLEYINLFINNKANRLDIWDEFKKIKLPSNSLIITDHYIIDKKENIKNNLEAMLDAILPSQLDVDYHISIITLEDYSEKKPTYFQERLANITKLREYKIKVNVYLVSKDRVHDRTILSNYWIAESGHGFDYYNPQGNIKGNHNTKLSISSINSVNYDYYEHIRLQMKSIVKDLKPVYTLDGNFKNRLFY